MGDKSDVFSTFHSWTNVQILHNSPVKHTQKCQNYFFIYFFFRLKLERDGGGKVFRAYGLNCVLLLQHCSRLKGPFHKESSLCEIFFYLSRRGIGQISTLNKELE